MNVAEIAQRVGEQLDFEPDLVRYKREVYSRIDNAYSALTIEQRWSWLRRKATVHAIPDITIPVGKLAVVTERVFSLVVDATTLVGTLYGVLDVAAFAGFQSAMVGGELDLYDREKRATGNGNWEVAPFVIERVAPDAATLIFHADPRCSITAMVGDEGGFTLRFPRLLLPVDVDQVLEVLDEEEQPLRALSPEEATRAWIRIEARNAPGPGRPIAYLTDEGVALRQPHVVSPASFIPGAANLSPDFYGHGNLPIREDPPFAIGISAGASNALLATTRYRVMVCWWYAGRFGPPSKVMETTTTATNKTVELTNLPVLIGTNYGRCLAVFMAEGDSGPFVLEGFHLASTSPTRTLSVRADFLTEPWASVRFDEVYPNGPYQYLRLYPPTDVRREMTITYYARPRRLLSANDEPEFRSTFHEYLVWATAGDIAGKHGAAAAAERWNVKAKYWLNKLTAHYQPEPRHMTQKGQVGGRASGLSDWPFKTITYLG